MGCRVSWRSGCQVIRVGGVLGYRQPRTPLLITLRNLGLAEPPAQVRDCLPKGSNDISVSDLDPKQIILVMVLGDRVKLKCSA